MKQQRQKRQIEREFGVPIAGEILPEEQWTQTALKHLPPDGRLDWQTLFGRQAPMVLDIGCGNGRYLLSSAVWRPDHDHVGIDVLPLVLRYATRRANQRGLANVRFAAADGFAFLSRYVAPGSLAEVHIYHPQPYHDQRQSMKRLIAPEFLAILHRSLEPAGQLFVQTDNRVYWNYMKEVLPAFFDFTEHDRPWLEAPRGRTRREIIVLRRGLPVYRGSGRAKTLASDEIARLVQSLPLPLFDAGPANDELDHLERE